MNYTHFERTMAQQVAALFTKVFGDSEGTAEGEAIGRLVSEIIGNTASEDYCGFVAIDSETNQQTQNIAAAIFFSRLTLPSHRSAFILSPVAVATARQGQGIGQALIHCGLDSLREQGVELVLTYGDPKYYTKVGFQKISESVIKAPKQLTFPEGWLALSLRNRPMLSEVGAAKCIEALNHQQYW